MGGIAILGLLLLGGKADEVSEDDKVAMRGSWMMRNEWMREDSECVDFKVSRAKLAGARFSSFCAKDDGRPRCCSLGAELAEQS